MGLPLGPLRRRARERPCAREDEPRAVRVRPALTRAGRALRRVLPTLALALLILTPAVAAGALAMRAGSGDEPPVPGAAAAALPGPTGPTGPTPPAGPVAATTTAGSTGASGLSGAAATPRPGADYYQRTTTRIVSASAEAGYVPLYREAARVYGVDWRLIASVHRQETAFSSEPSTYKGLNAYGCCAGPMQFNVTNGPVSTWKLYRQSFRQGNRPAAYPHPTRKHPSVYDDFDVMMAAGALLRDGGAGAGLDGGAWTAAYGYYGHDEFGVSYANQVVARALAWRRDGFAVNSADDPALIARLEDAYGGFERQKLRPAEQADEAKAERSRARRARRERAARGRARADAAARRSERRRSTPKPPAGGSPTPAPKQKPKRPSPPTPEPDRSPTPVPPRRPARRPRRAAGSRGPAWLTAAAEGANPRRRAVRPGPAGTRAGERLRRRGAP